MGYLEDIAPRMGDYAGFNLLVEETAADILGAHIAGRGVELDPPVLEAHQPGGMPRLDQ